VLSPFLSQNDRSTPSSDEKPTNGTPPEILHRCHEVVLPTRGAEAHTHHGGYRLPGQAVRLSNPHSIARRARSLVATSAPVRRQRREPLVVRCKRIGLDCATLASMQKVAAAMLP
jgi:hypothetical protein